MKKRLFYFFLLGLLGLLPEMVLAGERTYNILLIQSYNDRTPWHKQLIAGLRSGLIDGGVKVNLVTEYLNADFWDFSSECVIMRRICERARKSKTDLIVTIGDEAFYTLSECGDSLSYQLPVVASGLKYLDKTSAKKHSNIYIYTAKSDFGAILREAKRLFPNRLEVVCISDSSFLGRQGAKELKEYWLAFKKQNPNYNWKQLDLHAQIPNSIITCICYDYNAFNRIVIAPKWSPFLSFIGKNSKAPVFACQNLALTNGVLCVDDIDPFEMASIVGRRVANILKKELSEPLVQEKLNGRLKYDYKQLDFFNIDLERIENKYSILNTPLMERYRIWILLGYSLIVAALVFSVIWLFRLNRREFRRRVYAQTRLLIQQRRVEQRDELNNIFSSIRDGLITYDTDFRIHFVNRSLLLMLGLAPEVYTPRYYEGRAAGFISRIYINGKDVLYDLLKQACAEKSPVTIPEKAFMQENNKGTYFPISGEVVPIFANEKMTGVAIICRNISEEEMQKRFFNMAVEESSIYSWQYDMNKKAFYFPEGLLRRFKQIKNTDFISREEVDTFIHPDDLLAVRAYFGSILLGRKLNSRVNLRVRKPDGSYEWWEARSTAYDGLKPGMPYMILGVCQSIQRYKDTEDALIMARDRALQTDKLKTAFLANMSHEIRTPLNAIVGFSDLLRDIDSFTSEEVRQFVETINTNCTLLLALMSDILDLSRIESGTMEFQFSFSNLTFIMQQVYDSQRLSMPSEVILRTSFPEGEGKLIFTDSVRLKQVINNLINNAKKFTLQGSITLGYLVDEQGYVIVFVEDTGSGISTEAQKYIFERFYKVDNFTQGAGLGLSICKTIVDRLEGTISVTSELGKGTRFDVRLPDGNSK